MRPLIIVLFAAGLLPLASCGQRNLGPVDERVSDDAGSATTADAGHQSIGDRSPQTDVPSAAERQPLGKHDLYVHEGHVHEGHVHERSHPDSDHRKEVHEHEHGHRHEHDEHHQPTRTAAEPQDDDHAEHTNHRQANEQGRSSSDVHGHSTPDAAAESARQAIRPYGSQSGRDALVSLPDEQAEGLDADAIFEQRILPIFHSPKPSSCTECHLAGIDLKDYIHPDQAKTFAALRAGGMIDVQEPDDSKILEFIARGSDRSELITQEVRRQEFLAFRAWLRAAVEDPQLLQATSDSDLGPQLPVEVIRHAREDRVLASFIDNVWSEVRRCAGCHAPDKNEEYVKEWGEQVTWIMLGDPQATLDYLVDVGVIDVEAPAESELITKPTMQVDHGGGQKMLVGDRTYQQFLRFIEDYAAVVNQKYASPDELPAPSDEVSVASDIWLRLDDVPSHFDGMFLRADVYRWEGSRWSERPWATGDRAVWGDGKRWGQHLTVVAPRGSPRAQNLPDDPRLPEGRYLIKVYIDEQVKFQNDPWARFGPEDFVGQVEIESRWRQGHGSPTTVHFPDLSDGSDRR